MRADVAIPPNLCRMRMMYNPECADHAIIQQRDKVSSDRIVCLDL